MWLVPPLSESPVEPLSRQAEDTGAVVALPAAQTASPASAGPENLAARTTGLDSRVRYGGTSGYAGDYVDPQTAPRQNVTPRASATIVKFKTA